MPWVNSVSTFKDFLSLVIVHAPDDFPKEDYLSDDEQLTLESAFSELRAGVELFAKARHLKADDVAELQSLLDVSLKSYRSGGDIEGAHLLQDLESKAFR